MSLPLHERRILFFTLVGHALVHVYVMLFPPLLLPMGASFGLDLGGIAFYLTLVNFFFGLGALPAGWLVARWGEKPLLVAFFLGSAGGGTLVGLAQHRWMLGAGAVLLGLSASIYHPVGTALVSKGMRARGKAMGLNGIAGSVGTAVGPAYAALLNGWTSWRWPFLALTLPALCLGAWLWAVDLGPAAAPAPRESPERVPAEAPARAPLGLLTILGFLLAAMTLGGLYYNFVMTMLPTLLSENGFGPQTLQTASEALKKGGIWASISLAFGAVGQYIAGHLADRFDDRKLYVAVLAIAAPLVFLLGHLTGAPLLVAACAASTAIFAVQPVENTLLARFSVPRWRGVAYGAKFILTFGVGGTGSWLAGILKQRYGLGPVFDVAASITATGLFCAIVAATLRLQPGREPRPAEAAAAD